jgi:acetyltransferase-like isoleucine patch superfamily enzyme
MPTVVKELRAYHDEQGNEIRFGGHIERNITIRFRGRNNTLVVDDNARLGSLIVNFECDNGTLTIGPSSGVPAFHGSVRVGQDATIRIGANVSATSSVTMSAVEGTTIEVRDDVMFASRNQLRADDGHPIFDVTTGRRVNPARPIVVGEHVWVGWGAVLLAGASVGSGSVIGMNAIVSGKLPNNCIAVGAPARVVRKHVAWERPHLSLDRPYYKPDADSITPTRKYWQMTVEEAGPRRRTLRDRLPAPVRARLGRLRRVVHRRSPAAGGRPAG